MTNRKNIISAKEPSVVESINRSRKLSAKMKLEILKYVSNGSSRYVDGKVLGLRKPSGMKSISKKINGCSMGADNNGFFVYTHRARSESFKSPLKIPKKSIDFVDSTG